MTKIIAAVAALSFAFLAGVVLGAKQTKPEIKKIAVKTDRPRSRIKVPAQILNKKKPNMESPDQMGGPETSVSSVDKVEAQKFLNKKRTGYTVLLSSFKMEENANNYAKKIAGKGYDAFYFSKEIQGKTWHRVGVGSFSTKSTAESLKKQLTENRLGKGSLISTIPRNDPT